MKLKILSVVAITIALSGAAYGFGHGGGGGGGGHGGGGGGHFGGGGGGHFGGGGGGHFGGGAHFGGGGGHFGGMRGGGGGHFGGAHFGGARAGGGHFAGGGRQFSGRSAMHGAAGRANLAGGRGNLAGGRGNLGGNRFAGHNMEGNRGGRNAALRANAIHNALGSRSFARAMHNPGALRNPATRAALAAGVATAGWHNMHGGGWWQHGNGGYGWVGPLFWPFAYYDIYDYSLWGYDPFWWYGYNDIYAGLFAPYSYDDLAGYLPPGGYYGGGYGGGYSRRAGTPPSASTAENAAPDELSEMCGEDNREIAGLPIDRIQQAIQPDQAQRSALDDLANASVRAAQTIKAACPSKIVSTAPGRLAAMQTRLDAMVTAVGIVQPPLDHFWALLDEEQKSRLSALGQDQRNDRRGNRNGEAPSDQACGTQASVPEWPAAEIEQRLHPTEAQRASLANLKDASAKAAEMLRTTCAPDTALTPPTRLAAIGKRLDTMLQAVEMVKSAVDDLYKDLTDEQKAQFEAIGPGRTSSTLSSDETPSASGRHYRRRYHASIGGIVRRLISFGF